MDIPIMWRLSAHYNKGEMVYDMSLVYISLLTNMRFGIIICTICTLHCLNCDHIAMTYNYYRK